MQLDTDTQLTLERMAPTTPEPLGEGLGTTDHDVPFHCSMRVPVGFPVPDPTTAPTAQQLEPLIHVASKSPPPSPPGNGIGERGSMSCHSRPQRVGLAVDGPLPPTFPKVMPAAQHWRALTQVEPRKTSSSPVPGTVATYQPDVDASAVGTVPIPPHSAAAATTPESTAAPRRKCPMGGAKCARDHEKP